MKNILQPHVSHAHNVLSIERSTLKLQATIPKTAIFSSPLVVFPHRSPHKNALIAIVPKLAKERITTHERKKMPEQHTAVMKSLCPELWENLSRKVASRPPYIYITWWKKRAQSNRCFGARNRCVYFSAPTERGGGARLPHFRVKNAIFFFSCSLKKKNNTKSGLYTI